MAYPVGQCTYYVASRFPAIYGYMGNAQNWIKSATRLGYPVTSTPVPNSVVVYGPGGSYASEGHVAVVDSVNGDGTFNVSEMNYNGFDQVDQRRSTMDNVEGFIIPPGSGATTQIGYFGNGVGPKGTPTPGDASNPGVCITRWNLPLGSSICMDGVIGGAAMAGGGFIMLGGVVMAIALAMKSTGVGSAATKAVAGVSGPAGAVVAAHHAQQEKRVAAGKQEQAATQQSAAQSHIEAMRRSQLRTSRARARVAEGRAKQTGVTDEDRERAAERAIAATGKRPEPGTVKRRLAA